MQPLNEMELAELIEKYIEYVDETGRTVRLPANFVKHYLQRDDGDEGLPIVSSISQLPIVLPNGQILTGQGLDRKYHIIFRVPKELDALIPKRAVCTPAELAKAMRFLTDEWLADVAADYAGKCSIIAAAMMILERALLPERPVIFVTAGHRGGGKTTTLKLIIMAAAGLPAVGAGWSNDPEERRKALFTYLDLGLEYVIFDNIAKGSTISCPSIEKACTIEFYTDRVLGITGAKTVATYTILFFTGNNIAPRGDLASRALMVRLSVDRVDPENRPFKHPDPVEWTNEHRGQILASLYTILLGNPRRSQKKSERAAEPTRFKVWWDMIGSAVEFAAEQHLKLVADEKHGFVYEPTGEPEPTTVDFKSMFLESEDDEEQSASLASILDVLRRKWPGGSLFQAGDVVNSIFHASNASFNAALAEEADNQAASFKAALELACGKPIPLVSAPAINWKLQTLVDAPAVVDGKTLVLRYFKPDSNRHGGGFKVEELSTPEETAREKKAEVIAMARRAAAQQKNTEDALMRLLGQALAETQTSAVTYALWRQYADTVSGIDEGVFARGIKRLIDKGLIKQHDDHPGQSTYSLAADQTEPPGMTPKMPTTAGCCTSSSPRESLEDVKRP